MKTDKNSNLPIPLTDNKEYGRLNRFDHGNRSGKAKKENDAVLNQTG